MKRFSIIIFLMGFCLYGQADLVINEIFYDAIASDDGQEWIELYNNGSEEINLSGWILQAGGENFSDIYVFPPIIVRSNSFFLISESSSTLSNITTELGFENGGSATDGVRIINPANHYTDTILYDFPNSNKLEGDSINQTPCSSVSPGYSLARSLDGVDTNSATDFFSCPNPSPGRSNYLEKKVTLASCKATLIGSSINISTVIRNLSTQNVDKCELSIKILFNSELKCLEELSAISELDSLTYCTTIENEIYQTGLLEVEIINNSQVVLVDNLWKKWISYQNPALILSEIMYYPLADHTEWIEVKLLSDIAQTEVSILDAIGNEATSTIFGKAGDYLVIAQDKEDLESIFITCDSDKIFQANGWASLNNDGDAVLLNFQNTLLDSINYENNATRQGFSWEYSESTNTWNESCAETGASPTQANSSSLNPNLTISSGLNIVNNLISIKKEQVFALNFNVQKRVNSLEIHLFDIRGKETNTINANFSNQYVGEYSWNGYLKGKYLASGLYPTIVKIKSESGQVIAEKKILITINR